MRRRRSGVPSNAITERERDVEEREWCALSFVRSFVSPPLRRTRARARPRRTRRGIGARTLFPCLSSPRRASTRLRRAGPVIPLSEGAPWTRTRGRLARSTLLLSSCADRTRGGGRARAAPRDHGRYAVDPRAAAARNRVNASPVVLLVHFGRRPGRRETAGLSSSLVVDRFIRDSRGFGARLARARHGRTSNDRSYARARYGGAQAVFGYLNDPQPGVVRELYPWTAMCVRNVDVHVSCSSQVDAQLAAFFIDPRAK